MLILTHMMTLLIDLLNNKSNKEDKYRGIYSHSLYVYINILVTCNPIKEILQAILVVNKNRYPKYL